jgi:hypothetical protein
MSSVSVRIPTILRAYTGGSAEVTGAAGTLREMIAGLDAAYPGIGGKTLDDTDEAAQIRQCLRRGRGRAACAGTRHPGAAGIGRVGDPGCGRRLMPGRDVKRRGRLGV